MLAGESCERVDGLPEATWPSTSAVATLRPMLSMTLAFAASVFLLFANSFFVASEFALVKVRPTRLSTLAASGNRRARVALGVTRQLDAYLSANQLGITLASLGLGWLGEPAFARMFEPWLSQLGDWTGLATHSLSAAFALAVITLLHVVIGELVPKALALQLTEPVALWTVVPLRVFFIAAFPVIWSFNALSRLTLRFLRLREASEAELVHSSEELRLVLAQMSLDARARKLIDRVFDYTQRTASQIMTLRRDLVVLHVERSFADNLQTAVSNQFTRYPLVDADDQVTGYVHIKDLIAVVATGRTDVELASLAREPVYARVDAGLEDLRREFQNRRVHIAMVRDSDRKVIGIVTLEDLLEEFVGEIRDEQDAAEVPPIVRSGSDRFDADGRLTLDVVERELGLHVRDVPPAVETLGELVVTSLGAAPRVGATVDIGGFILTIVELRDQRVTRVHGERRERRRSRKE